MELRDYVRILHKNWILILILLVLGLAGGAGYAALQAPKYVASTQLYVSVRTEGAATGDLVQGTTFARQMVTSYVDVVNTALVLDPVIDELGLDTTVAGLASREGVRIDDADAVAVSFPGFFGMLEELRRTSDVPEDDRR